MKHENARINRAMEQYLSLLTLLACRGYCRVSPNAIHAARSRVGYHISQHTRRYFQWCAYGSVPCSGD